MNSRILPALALMLAIGIFFMYVNPTWSGTIAATKAAIAADDQALEAAAVYTGKQDALIIERNAIDLADLARLEVFLPSSVDNVRLILDLNALAARSGLSLSNIDVAASTASTESQSPDAGGVFGSTDVGPVGSVDMSLSAVGTYSALKTFLRDIERSARLLDIQDLTIKGSDTGVYTYQMKLRLYWLH